MGQRTSSCGPSTVPCSSEKAPAHLRLLAARQPAIATVVLARVQHGSQSSPRSLTPPRVQREGDGDGTSIGVD